MPAATATKPATAKKLSGRDALIQVLKKHGKPMKVSDLIDAALKLKGVTGLRGKTPKATLAAVVYADAKKGKNFRKVDRGMVEYLPPTE